MYSYNADYMAVLESNRWGIIAPATRHKMYFTGFSKKYKSIIVSCLAFCDGAFGSLSLATFKKGKTDMPAFP